MPHEKINYPRTEPMKQLVVGWNAIGWVNVSIYPDGWTDTGEAEHVELNPQELDLLIKTLRRAKRVAYADGNRHTGFEDGAPVESRPLWPADAKRDAWQRLNAILDTNGGQDSPEYRAAFADFEQHAKASTCDDTRSGVQRAADERYPESPFAPENEQLAEAFLSGALWMQGLGHTANSPSQTYPNA